MANWRCGNLMCRCFCEKELLPEISGSVKALCTVQEPTQEIGQSQTSFIMCSWETVAMERRWFLPIYSTGLIRDPKYHNK